MNQKPEAQDTDPLGLGDLPLLEPDRDGWAEIRQALEAEPLASAPARHRRAAPWLALAACLALVVTVVVQQAGSPLVQPTPELADQAKDATPAESLASEEQDDTLTDLIAMSQMLEIRLKGLRDGTGALPGQSALYVAELEDMVAMVDGELSFDPESLDLWGQRVNLLLDLEYIYQHQWEREYGRMAAR